MKYRHSTTLVLLFVVGCTQASSSGRATSEPANRDEAAAADAGNQAEVTLQVLDYQGIQDLVASHRGKIVVMDAWATSCGPCVREFPNLVALHKKYGPEKIACISLSFDNEGIDDIEEVKKPVLKFLRDNGATFDNVISSIEADALYQKFDLTAVPAVFVYNRSGELRKRFDNDQGGEFTYQDVGKLVAELMDEPAPTGDEP